MVDERSDNVIDMSGDGGAPPSPSDFPDPSIITEEGQQEAKEAEEKANEDAGEEKKVDDTNKSEDDGVSDKKESDEKDLSQKAADDGEKSQTFVEAFPDFADFMDDKNISIEDGKKLISEMFKGRQDLEKSKSDFEQQYQQYFEMDSLMNTDKELADFIWKAIQRRKQGLPLTKKEEKVLDQYEDDGTPTGKPDKEKEELKKRVEGLEAEFKNRDKAQRVSYYENLIKQAVEKHTDKDGNALLSSEDIHLITERAIVNKSDDIIGIADQFVKERNDKIETIVSKRLEDAKESMKADIIKEYLALKDEDKEKYVDVKDAQAPAGQPKSLSLDDDSAKKGFLSDLKAAFTG